MNETVFPLSRGIKGFTMFFYAFAAFAAVMVVASTGWRDDGGGLAFFAVWVAVLGTQGWWLLFRMPQRIVVRDDGLRFEARARTVAVPWPALRSVSPLPLDVARQLLRWRWDGGSLWTWAAFDGLHRLLTMVEQRAPQVDLDGL